MIRRICTARQRLARRDEGTTAVEFALVFPVVAMVCFAALYGALFFFYSAVADHVANSVARQVSIPLGQTGTAYPDATPGTVASDAARAAGSLLPNPTSVTTSSLPTGTAHEGGLVTVTVTYKLPVLGTLGGLVPGLSGIETITSSATERRQ